MPVYEYSCPKCGVIEVIQKITEPAIKTCPNCKSKVKKLISQTNFQLKGAGWYATDYAGKGNGGNRGTAKKDKKSPSAESCCSESKNTDAKLNPD